jgi:putative aldouronate transport system permease protein
LKSNAATVKPCATDRVVYIANTVLLTVFLMLVLYPFLYILSCSFSSGQALNSGKVFLLPVEFTTEGYLAIFQYKDIWTGFANSFLYTIVFTIIGLVLTILCAYPLSQNDLIGKKPLMFLFLFTMLFSGGLIPNYLLVMKLGFRDTIWSLVLPGALSAYNMIVARTYLMSAIPRELHESAALDGCGEFRFLFSIVIPLSKAIIAVLALWLAMWQWNTYFNPMIYLNDKAKYPLQLVLREILLMANVDFTKAATNPDLYYKNQQLSAILRYGTIIISSLPLMILYPFIQKYFVHGIMIGSVKG